MLGEDSMCRRVAVLGVQRISNENRHGLVFILIPQYGSGFTDPAAVVSEVFIWDTFVNDLHHVGSDDLHLNFGRPRFLLPLAKILRADVANVVAPYGDAVAGVLTRERAIWVENAEKGFSSFGHSEK